MIARRSTIKRLETEVERLQTELRLTREENERQRAGLVADIRDAFEVDVIGRLRQEYKTERSAARRRHRQLLRLAELARGVIRLDALNPLAPVIDPEQAERQMRKLLAEIEESEVVAPVISDEQAAERAAIGRRVD